MKKIILIPKDGIEIYQDWNNIILTLWDTLEKVISKIWNPIDTLQKKGGENICYYLNNSLQLWFIWWKLSAIQITYDLCENIYLKSFNLFKLNCEYLINNLSNIYWEFKEEFKKTSYINFEYSIWFWRPTTPKDIEADLLENDYQKWIYFSTILIWKEWYFN